MITLTTPPDQLTAKDAAILLRGYHYRILVTGVYLVSVPAPDGYIQWSAKDQAEALAIESFLSTHQIVPV